MLDEIATKFMLTFIVTSVFLFIIALGSSDEETRKIGKLFSFSVMGATISLIIKIWS